MISAQVAQITAALFAGAAIYISVAEQPARLTLDDRAMLLQWKWSYHRAAPMQASLALISAITGGLAFSQDADWRWMVGAILILANWPYTLLLIRPTNVALHGVDEAIAGPSTRTLVEWWGLLHSVRAVLGAAATLAYFWAMN